MAKRTAVWVTRYSMGRVLSTHMTREAADKVARRVERLVESAQVVALVQGGMPYTIAVQACAGTDYLPVAVEVGT